MSNQGFGGDDDKDKNDIERLFDAFNKAKGWYDENQDLFEKFASGGESVDLAGGDPISEAHVDEDRVLIVAEMSGVNATDLKLNFYDNKVDGELGERKFSVNVPEDVNEDSIDADMKNGVLRIELEREGSGDDSLTVDTVDDTQDTLDKWESEEGGQTIDEIDEDELQELFDDEDENNGGEQGGDE